MEGRGLRTSGHTGRELWNAPRWMKPPASPRRLCHVLFLVAMGPACAGLSAVLSRYLRDDLGKRSRGLHPFHDLPLDRSAETHPETLAGGSLWRPSMSQDAPQDEAGSVWPVESSDGEGPLSPWPLPPGCCSSPRQGAALSGLVTSLGNMGAAACSLGAPCTVASG